MNPFIVGAGITIIILALLFGKPAVDTIRKMRANAKTRTEMFECIGAEWIMRMNKVLDHQAVDRDRDQRIQERLLPQDAGWLILVPARNVGTGAPFALVISATMPIPKPTPHVKTILMDIVVTTRDHSEWWIAGECLTVYPRAKQKLDQQGVIFDIAETGTA